MLARANKLGITLLAGTDMFPPGSVWREVAALQQAGIEPRDALAAASTVARAFLREPALDEGAPADLVWYEHDPRNEPELLARPGLVMLGGARIH
jgi:imidazolonepropionase-like amidohydrolase